MPPSPHLLVTAAVLLCLAPASEGKVVLDLQWNGTDVLGESFQELFTVRRDVHNMAQYLTSKIDQVMGSWCPRPFKAVMSQCFYVNNKHPMSWDEGRDFCRRMGGDLAQPAFPYALLAVLTEQYPRERSIYLGASYRRKEDGWRWVSGRTVDLGIWGDQSAPEDDTVVDVAPGGDDALRDKAKGVKGKGDHVGDGKPQGDKARGLKAQEEKPKPKGDKAQCLVLCRDGCVSSHAAPQGQDCDLDGALVCEYRHK